MYIKNIKILFYIKITIFIIITNLLNTGIRNYKKISWEKTEIQKQSLTLNKFFFKTEKYKLIYFGYTTCPDICPISTALITEILNKTNSNNKIQPIFITIDPNKDSIPKLKKYLKKFHKKIIAITGSKKCINKLKTKFKIFTTKIKIDEQNKSIMDHSNTIFILNKNNENILTFNFLSNIEEIISILSNIMN